jgi:hypothetical protein
MSQITPAPGGGAGPPGPAGITLPGFASVSGGADDIEVWPTYGNNQVVPTPAPTTNALDVSVGADQDAAFPDYPQPTYFGVTNALAAFVGTIDFGATPVKQGTFSFANGFATPTSKVFITTAGVTLTGKGTLTDEIIMQGLITWVGFPGAGIVTVAWWSDFWQYGQQKYNCIIF